MLSRRPTVRFARAVPAAVLVAAVVFCLPVGCGVPGPGGADDSFGLDFSMPAGATSRGAVVFFVDGVNAEIFDKMLQAGQLPAIKKYFVDRGLYVRRAVASTPSVTMCNQISVVTGLFPGHHGVTGINWFDRNRLIWRNYETIAQKNTLDGDYTAGSLYEQFPGATTVSIFFQAHRGATKFMENWTSAGPPFFFGWYEFIDRLTLSRFNLVMDIARTRGRFPALVVAYLLAPDFRAYGHGVRHGRYRQALRHTDRQIGRVLGDLARAGRLDDVIIALVSDHSLTEVTRHFPIGRYLRERVGLDVATRRLWERAPFEKRLDYYRRFSTVLYGSGDRYWSLCLRRPIRRDGEVCGFEAWPVRPAPADLSAYPTRLGVANLLDMLTQLEAVDAVAYAVGPNRVRVRRADGEVQFTQDDGPGGAITYRLIRGQDPLGWRGAVPAEMLAGAPRSPIAWLAATAGTSYPDLPAQIVAYFRAARAGDLAVFAAAGWDFGTVNRAGHGGLRPGDMCVPLLLAGPGVPHERRRAARTVDLMPTLLALLGRPIPRGLDGRCLVALPEVSGAGPTERAEGP